MPTRLIIGKNDASYGHLMKLTADATLQTIPPLQSGFAITGEVRDIKVLHTSG